MIENDDKKYTLKEKMFELYTLIEKAVDDDELNDVQVTELAKTN